MRTRPLRESTGCGGHLQSCGQGDRNRRYRGSGLGVGEGGGGTEPRPTEMNESRERRQIMMNTLSRRLRKLEDIQAEQEEEEGPSIAEILRAGRWSDRAGGQVSPTKPEKTR